MPLTAAGRKVLRNMQEHYGKEKGKQVFYAMEHTHQDWRRRGWRGNSFGHKRAAEKGWRRRGR